jgi:hypothetical protein
MTMNTDPRAANSSNQTEAPRIAPEVTMARAAPMKTSRKFLCFSSLIAACLLSLLLSFLGLFGLTWGGTPQAIESPSILILFFPYLLAFPLFALAVAVSRLGSLALWIAVPLPGLAVFEGSVHDFKGGPLDLVKFLVLCCYPALPLLLLAALVQFGTHFYELTYDRRWVRWKEALHEPAA